MVAVLMLATVLTADPQAVAKEAWTECLRAARTKTQVQECQEAFMGGLVVSTEPDSEHGGRIAALVAAHRASSRPSLSRLTPSWWTRHGRR